MTPADEWDETREGVAAAIRRAMQDGQGENDVIALATDSILKLIEAARQSDGGWQPIETAPRDGEVVLIFTPRTYPRVTAGHWRDDLAMVHWQAHGHRWHLDEDVTHWRPLPPAPHQATSTEDGK